MKEGKIMDQELVNERLFLKQNEKKYIFDRKHENNRGDIAGSAALALHKAIIGICGLHSLEQAEQSMNVQFRQQRAVQTYYIIYHLFTCCMLLDESYEIVFSPRRGGQLNYGSELPELRKLPEKPEEWNYRKNKEMDLAVRIKHGDIKQYCEEKRKANNQLPPFLQTIYNAFICDNCSVFPFEKADYIRDRAIYRPSFVATKTGTPIQTSKNVRTQIDSLPRSKKLHEVVCTFLNDVWSIPGDKYYPFFMHLINSRVSCPTEYAKGLGYSWEQLSKAGGSEIDESVPSWVCQMMELYNPEELQLYYDRYWKKVYEDAKQRWFS